MFIVVLIKLRAAFDSIIKKNRLKLSLEEMERITEQMAREYCRGLKSVD